MNADPVSIRRTVKAGCEAEFERALHEFMQRSLLLPAISAGTPPLANMVSSAKIQGIHRQNGNG